MRIEAWAIIALLGCGSNGGEIIMDAGADVSEPDTGAADAGPDTSVPDTGPDASDAGVDAPVDAAIDTNECSLGVTTTSATATNPSLFGEAVPIADGADLPAGTIRIRYVDGCFKFAADQGWTIHARDTGGFNWWLIDGTTSEQLVFLPGTIGIYPTDTAYADFEECVAANLLLEDVLYEHDGGPLSIFLTDSNYPDNVSGVDDRNPAWEFIQEDCVE